MCPACFKTGHVGLAEKKVGVLQGQRAGGVAVVHCAGVAGGLHDLAY